MKAIIVEDEAIAARRLQRLIKEVSDDTIEILNTFESVADTATYLLENEPPDLIFLDIQVADGNSFELFNIIPQIQSEIVFTTAYTEFAPQAFRKNALDYLLKPIKKSELQEAIKKKRRLSKTQIDGLRNNYTTYKNRFLIRFGAKIHVVKTEEIAYIYSANKISYFVLKDGKKTASDFRLQSLETMLDPVLFFRANRQIIIHIDSILEILTYSKSRVKIRLNPPYKEDIVVSSETTPKFKKWLDR